jgi:hypothetical protein
MKYFIYEIVLPFLLSSPFIVVTVNSPCKMSKSVVGDLSARRHFDVCKVQAIQSQDLNASIGEVPATGYIDGFQRTPPTTVHDGFKESIVHKGTINKL